MSRSRKRTTPDKWVADFETTTTEDDCRVWSWGVVNESTGEYFKGLSIDGFLEWCEETRGVVYFHNLRFDGQFILPWLYRNGYSHTEARSPGSGEFTTVISGMGSWYALTVRWPNGKTTEFLDSLKKLPMSVAAIAKSFDLEISKGEIDYHKPRPIGYVPTPEEDDYQENDVRIVAQALHVVMSEGALKMTVASDAMADFKRRFGEKRFSRVFPVLDSEIDEDLRNSYRGGFTYATERFRRKMVGRGNTFDVNSLYPSVMYNERLRFPMGEPEMMHDLPDDWSTSRVHIFKVVFTAVLKRDHVPCIQLKNHSRFTSAEYVEVVAEPTEFWCTEVDWRLWNDHYDIELHEFQGGYAFRTCTGIFREYIDFWADKKANTTGGQRALAKLMLNSLYGKFGTNPNRTGRVPVMCDDGVVRFERGSEQIDDSVYVAMASFITAYARDVTIRAAQAHYDSFAYADTDSLHLLGETLPEGLDIHPSRLGAWKHEYGFSEAVFSRAKCYTELIEGGRKDGEYETHIAGMPENLAETVRFEHHITGHTFDGKLMPRAVPGGVVLIPTTFRLNMSDH